MMQGSDAWKIVEEVASKPVTGDTTPHGTGLTALAIALLTVRDELRPPQVTPAPEEKKAKRTYTRAQLEKRLAEAQAANDTSSAKIIAGKIKELKRK